MIEEEAFRLSLLDRSLPFLTAEGAARLRGMTVGIAGCGGVGGVVAATLARMGVGRFNLADPGRFDAPDLNRQIGATRKTLGHNKAAVYREFLRDINRFSIVRTWEEGIREDTVDPFLESADILVDCLDLSVPLELRGRMFRAARERGIVSITAPILGFGAAVFCSDPQGMSMDVLLQFLGSSQAGGGLPPALYRFFTREHLDRIGEWMAEKKTRVPSVAVAPLLAGSIVATEALAALVGDIMPAGRRPVCLPRFYVVDLHRQSYRVVDVEIFLRPEIEPAGASASSPRADSPAVDRSLRERVLLETHRNVQIIPSGLVPLDFLTDSLKHQALEWDPAPPATPLRPVELEIRDAVRELFGFPHSIPLAQGRSAEALVARLLVRKGDTVPSPLPFLTTRLHPELAGAECVDVSTDEARDLESLFPFKGNVDLDGLARLIRQRRGKIPYVSLETCLNAVGGQPFSMENLEAASRLLKKHRIPLFLDAARILDHAFLVRRREPRFRNAPVWGIVREICSHADGMTLSLTKDFATPIGGIAAFREKPLCDRGYDFVMAMGDGLSQESLRRMARALRQAGDDPSPVERRIDLVQLLHDELRRAGFPLFAPAGGHAALLDLSDLVPHLAEDGLAAESVNHELYREFGLRGSPHLIQRDETARWLRLAVPILKYDEARIREAVGHLARWHADRQRTPGLRRDSKPEGLSGEFRAAYAVR